MSQDRVMLLIDADNVSVDVMEQAVRLLLNQHGGLHVRRAYCTAESAVANQAAFKRLGIKPMVNLAAGKNSTDIALAVDAVDLVLAERPEVVVIASSDSDFAPLVHRLREKGCVVRGIGQLGKVGDETQDVYDDFTVLEHHKAAGDGGAARTARGAAAKTPRKTTAKAAAKPTARATDKAITKSAAKTPAAKKSPAAKKAATKAASTADAAAKPVARKAAPRRSAAAASALEETAAPAPVAAPMPAASPTPAPVPARSRAGGSGAASEEAVLACLPELAAGKALALNVAVQRLREAQLLGKNSSSLKLFAQLSARFELAPADKPTQVRWRG